MKKIALEEHFWTEGFLHTGETGKALFQPSFLRSINAAMGDFGELRIAAMDKAGIEVSVLSLISPGVQIERDHAKAESEARRANDVLAAEISRHPTRYAGFAHLPMQEPKAAAKELERCVTELKFKGALINGHSNGVYLDDARYLPFWECVAGPRRSDLPASGSHAGPSAGVRGLPRTWLRRCGAGPRKPAATRSAWC